MTPFFGVYCSKIVKQYVFLLKTTNADNITAEESGCKAKRIRISYVLASGSPQSQISCHEAGITHVTEQGMVGAVVLITANQQLRLWNNLLNRVCGCHGPISLVISIANNDYSWELFPSESCVFSCLQHNVSKDTTKYAVFPFGAIYLFFSR